MRTWCRTPCLYLLTLLFGIPSSVQCIPPDSSATRPAVPVDPITAILDAFHTHHIVALGEGTEGNLQAHNFRLSLIRDPRFAATVDDIVVEFGNSRYQEVMDRFVRGEEISSEELRRVWQNTTQPNTIWDAPIYEEFYRVVREINMSHPQDRQLRVLLGDPPIDWDKISRKEDYGRWDRDGYPADLVKREVLAKGHRALVIYGDLHFIRKNPLAGGGENDWAYSITGILEKTNTTKCFTVHTIAYGIDLEKVQPDVLSWPRPSCAILRGTVLGAASFSTYYPRPLVVDSDGKQAALPDNRRPLLMEEQFDALLYLGPLSSITTAQLSPALCSDSAYVGMRLGRMMLLGLQMEVDRLKDYCASLAGNVEIRDQEPALTALLAEIIRDAATGKADPKHFSTESREKLVRFLKQNGPRFMGSLGDLKHFTLLSENSDGGRRVRRYRAEFASGQKIIWTAAFSSEGKIISLDPRRE
jgi:hypothetical protein